MFFEIWFWSILTCLGLSAIAYGWYVNQFFKNKDIIFIKPQLFVGSMFKVLLARKHTIDLTVEAYRRFPNEKYVGFFTFMKPVLLVKDPDLIKRVLVKDFEHFIDHLDFVDEEADPIVSRNLFALKGEKWREVRTTLSPAFTCSKIRDMMPFIRECVENLVQHLECKVDEALNKGNNYAEVDADDITRRFASDVIASCAFGIKLNSCKDRTNSFYKYARKLVIPVTVDFIRIFLIAFILNSKAAKFLGMKVKGETIPKFFHKIITENTRMRENEHIIRNDMIHLLILAKNGSLNTEKNNRTHDAGYATLQESSINLKSKKTVWSDEEITGQAMAFIFAGLETVATVLNFFINELALHPDVQKRLHRELDEFMETSNGKIDYENLNKLKYLDMVISETLRLWPPALFLNRVCVKPYMMPSNREGSKPKKINKGDWVWVSVYALQRDPANFKDPEKFDPERFSDENKPFIKPQSFMPFGYGPRGCIGSRFALVEMKMLAVLILSKFEIIPTPKTPKVLVINPTFLSLQSKYGYTVGFKRRKQ